MMISVLRYRAERAAAWFAVIDARTTSQQYSQCGRTQRQALAPQTSAQSSPPNSGKDFELRRNLVRH